MINDKLIEVFKEFSKDSNNKFDSLEDFLNYAEDLLSSHITTEHYLEVLENNDINSMIDYICGCEFNIIVNKDGTLSLEDLQGANLGDIESETFETIEDICNRLEGSYFNDYYGIEIY